MDGDEHFARNLANPVTGAITPARMICRRTRIGTRAVASSSERERAETNSPIAVPATARAARVAHWMTARPDRPHKTQVMPNKSDA